MGDRLFRSPLVSLQMATPDGSGPFNHFETYVIVPGVLVATFVAVTLGHRLWPNR